MKKITLLMFCILLLLGSSIEVSALCWNPLELFCIFGGGDSQQASGETPLPPEEIEQTVTYTSTTETQCKDGKCNLVLYSGTRFVEEDGWKRIEEAKSLNNSGIRCIVDSDEEHMAICDDFNFTHRKIRYSMSPTSLKDKTKIPFKITLTNGTELSSELKDLTNEKNEWIEVDFGDIIKIGDKSTTIILQTNESENLDDSFVDSANPDNNFGKQQDVRIRSSAGQKQRGYIKFNISSIPLGIQIDSAKLVVYISGSNEVNRNISVHHLYIHNWTEGSLVGADASGQDYDTNLTWNNQPCGTAFDNSVFCNLTAEDNKTLPDIDGFLFNNFTVLNMVRHEYEDNTGNVSIILRDSQEGGGNGFRIFRSKEYMADISTRPILNITYSVVGGDTTPPTFSAFSDNSSFLTINDTTVQLSATIEDDSNISAYFLSTNDTLDSSWKNETIINLDGLRNVTTIWNYTIRNFTNGGTFGWRFWANDTANNSAVSAIQTFFVFERENPNSNITLNNTSPKINQVVNISMNVSDNLDLDFCWFYNNISNTNSSLISISGTSEHNLCFNITTINVSHRDVLFRGYVNDTSGNVNSSQTVITVANTVPTQPIISFPENGINYSSIPYINFTATDADSDLLTFNIYINGSLNITTTTNITQWNASDGYYNLTVTANDGIDSSINSTVIIFRLDSTNPSFSNQEKNETPNTGENLRMNITITESNCDSYKFF